MSTIPRNGQLISHNETATASRTSINASESSVWCELCREAFHPQKRVPVLLPCFHSFCNDCVQSLRTKGHFRCPQCNKAIPGTESFPVDVTLLVLMDMRLCRDDGRNAVCQGCSEGRQATNRCRDCAQFLCGVCFSAHQRVKISKDHVVMPLCQAANNPTMFIPPLEKCSLHPDKSMDYFCSSCRVLVCPACALDLHRGCTNVVVLSNILKEKKKELMNAGAQLNALRVTLRSKESDAEATHQALEIHLEDGERRVEKIFAELAEMLGARKGEMLAELRQQATIVRTRLDQQTSQLRHLCAGTETVADYVARLLELNLAPQILLQKPGIDATAADLSQYSASLQFKALEFKIITDKMSELKHMIKNFVRIAPPQDHGEAPVACTYEPLPSQSAKIHQRGLAGATPNNLRITCPVFALDLSRCSPRCTLEEDGGCISNHSRNVFNQTSRNNAFKFNGTCVTSPLPNQTCFWQTSCKINLSPLTPEGSTLVEVGAATEKAMQSAVDTVAPCDSFVLAARLYKKQGSICARAHYRNEMLVHAKLAQSAGKDSVEVNLGFLLDCTKKRFIVIDVSTCRILCECPAETVDAVYPFINVMHSKDSTGADVRVMLQTGQEIKMTRNLASVMHNFICSC